MVCVLFFYDYLDRKRKLQEAAQQLEESSEVVTSPKSSDVSSSQSTFLDSSQMTRFQQQNGYPDGNTDPLPLSDESLFPVPYSKWISIPQFQSPIVLDTTYVAKLIFYSPQREQTIWNVLRKELQEKL